MLDRTLSLTCVLLVLSPFSITFAAAPAAPMPEAAGLPVRNEMPDPMILNSGERVATPQQWQQRREEMKAVLEYYFLGHAPAAPGNVTGEVVESKKLVDGTVVFELVRVRFGPEQKLTFELAVFKPANERGPTATIVHPTFHPTPGTKLRHFPTALSANAGTQPTTRSIERQKTFALLAEPENAAKLFAEPLRRGYAVAAFHYQQFGLDQPAYRDSGFFKNYPDADWADLRAWAWGMSRVADYLEQQPFADKSKLIGVGHSRLGKTTLIAGAFDDRFALVAPAGSGCAGTGAFRINGKLRGGKEGLEELTKNFPQWCSPRLSSFAGQVEKLPFDQNWLISLVAPRAFIAADALDDPYANGAALKVSYVASQPVYKFLGAPENLGIHFRPGGHSLSEDDWTAILDFADARLRGKTPSRRFDELPADELLK